MKRSVRVMIIIMTIAVVAISASISFWPQIAVRIFSAASGLDITYDGIKKASLTEIALNNVTALSRAKGVGLSADSAVIRPLWNGADPRNATIAFEFRNVHFLKKTADAPISYNNLDGLVALPFSSNWVYSVISGKVRSDGKGIAIKDFMAKSSDMKLAFSGTIAPDNSISFDITIHFADTLTRKIPPELTKMVLNNEPEGWKSLAVKLEGNYSAPRIEVSSKLFRLKIAVKDA